MKKNYVICQTCRYIMDASKLHDVCPACGVPAKAFQPYKPKINQRREKVLSMHLHPIILHFPQAVVVFALLLFSIIPFLSGEGKDYITICAKFNAFLLPLCIVGGICSGLLDGKFRFKSVTTPLLIKKIMFSCTFLIISIVIVLILLLTPLTLSTNILVMILLLVATLLAAVLGKMGSGLVGSVFPG